MNWIISSLAVLGGLHALNGLYHFSMDALNRRRGTFTSSTRKSAKSKLRMELMTAVAAAKMGVSTFDTSGADAFVDDLMDATKEELRAEWLTWE